MTEGKAEERQSDSSSSPVGLRASRAPSNSPSSGPEEVPTEAATPVSKPIRDGISGNKAAPDSPEAVDPTPRRDISKAQPAPIQRVEEISKAPVDPTDLASRQILTGAEQTELTIKPDSASEISPKPSRPSSKETSKGVSRPDLPAPPEFPVLGSRSEPAISRRLETEGIQLTPEPSSREVPDELGTALRSKLLQSAWQVQQQVAPTIGESSQMGIEQLRENRGHDQMLPVALPEGERARQILEVIAPERATESSVEFLPPRRPRATSTVHQKRSEVSGRPATPLVGEPSLSSVMREIDATGEASGAEPAQMVPTEIGPLPRDLWELIGYRPPISGDQPAAHADSTDPGRIFFKKTPQGETGAPDRSAEPPIADISSSTSAPTIQRQSVTALDSRNEAAGERRGKEDPRPEHENEVDLDELARKVYEEVRRRFLLERERLRK